MEQFENQKYEVDETDIILFLRTLFEERKFLEKMIIELRKEVNEKDTALKKHTGDKCPYPTYMDLESDILQSYYDNPVFKKHYEYLEDLVL